MLSPQDLLSQDPEIRKRIRLPIGQMPIVGLGLWLADDHQQLEVALEAALEAGYRHFDTAALYKNEHVLGKVLRTWLWSGKVKREELFIVTKLPAIGLTVDKVQHFMNLSLKKLELDYVDLYLCHSPVGVKYVDDDTFFPTDVNGAVQFEKHTNLEGVWKEMEKLVHQGKAKQIGISNFNERQVDRLMKIARVPPANIQIEIHAYFQNRSLRACAKRHNISVVAYAPLGSPGRPNDEFSENGVPNLLEDPVILEIAKKHKKTSAQILLRFLVQQEVAVIPKSTNVERLRENIDIFDFKLTNVDMRRIESLDKGEVGRSFTGAPGWKQHPECPF